MFMKLIKLLGLKKKKSIQEDTYKTTGIYKRSH